MESEINYILGDRLPSPLVPIEIAPGILWVRLPMPMALDHINIYLLDDGDQWVLIDTGLGDTISIQTWELLLQNNLSGRRIGHIIGTHFHPDHVGLAGWLINKTEAQFWMTQIEWLSARQAYLDIEDASSILMQRFYYRCGINPDEIEEYRKLGNDYRSLVTPIPATYKRITSNTTFKVGNRVWEPIFGSGHSPDHVALFSKNDEILLGGDMLLPKITPIIAVWWQEPESDPLKDYLDFLGSINDLTDRVLILPAHNRPYREVRKRISNLQSHHEERLSITQETCRNPSTARDVMRSLFPRKLDPFQTRFAIGETMAHINNLLFKSELTRYLDHKGQYRFEQ